MNAQQVWQAQTIDAPRISLAYVRHIASDFERRRRWRAAVGYVVTLGACALHGHLALKMFSTKPLLAASSLCFVLLLLCTLYRLYRHMTAEASPADAGVLDSLRFQRRQLERQRNWRRRSWRWMVPGALPGFGLSLASLYFEVSPVPWKYMGFVVLVFVVAVGLTIVDAERKARRSQLEIDALDSLAGDPG